MEAQEKVQVGPFGLAEAGFQGQRPSYSLANLGGHATVRLSWAKEHDAEARAIVAQFLASTDMREALEELMADGSFPGDWTIDEYMAWVRVKARTALEKAKGERRGA